VVFDPAAQQRHIVWRFHEQRFGHVPGAFVLADRLVAVTPGEGQGAEAAA
jgi:hypothetical protein